MITEYDDKCKADIARMGQLGFDVGEIACAEYSALEQARRLPGPTTLDRLILGIAYGAEKVTRIELSPTNGLPEIGIEGVGTFQILLDPTGQHLQVEEVLR